MTLAKDDPRFARVVRAFACSLLLALLAPPACDVGAEGDDAALDGGGSDTASPGSGTRHTGALAGPDGETGVLELFVDEATSSATGTLRRTSGGNVTLDGSYASSGALSVSGGGYSLSGTTGGGAITGGYTGPKGSGSFAVLPDASGAASVFCGTYMGDTDGAWNLVQGSGGEMSGAMASTAGDFDSVLTGSRSKDSVSLTFEGGTATGTCTTKTCTGTWSAGANLGTWSATTGECP